MFNPKVHMDLQIAFRTIYLLRAMQPYKFQYFNLIWIFVGAFFLRLRSKAISFKTKNNIWVIQACFYGIVFMTFMAWWLYVQVIWGYSRNSFQPAVAFVRSTILCNYYKDNVFGWYWTLLYFSYISVFHLLF